MGTGQMSRIRINHSIFPLGEVDPIMMGNVDIEMYNNCLQQCRNFIPLPTGGATKRGGSEYLTTLPGMVDGLKPIILGYNVFLNEKQRSFLIVINALEKKGEENYHEPEISFFDLDSETWIKEPDTEERYIIRFRTLQGNKQKGYEYWYPICPSFEQFMGSKTIENGNSIIIFSQYLTLCIYPAMVAPFEIKRIEYTVPPFSFQTGEFSAQPRTVKQTSHENGQLACDGYLVVDLIPQDEEQVGEEGYTYQVTPTSYLSLALSLAPDSDYLDDQGKVPNRSFFNVKEPKSIEQPPKYSYCVQQINYGQDQQHFYIMYKTNDEERPDLAWNGRIVETRVTKYRKEDEARRRYFATLVVTLDKDLCPVEESDNEIVGLPGKDPINGNIPADGPQRTARFYISALGLSSSLENLGGLLYNEGEEDKEVYVGSIKNEIYEQSRNFVEGIEGYSRGGGGFPKNALLFEGRLFVANIGVDTNGLWGSGTEKNDWFNFMPGIKEYDGIRTRISSMSGTYINWLASTTKLFVGTVHGVYILGSVNSSNEATVTPTNCSDKLISSISTSEVQPVNASDAILFLNGKNDGLFEIILDTAGVYRVNNISMFSPHMLRRGAIANAWLDYPEKGYYAVTKEGSLVSVTYQKNNNIMGWAKHEIGGNGKVTGILDMLGIKSNSGNDSLVLVTERVLQGKNIISLERLYPTSKGNDLDASHLDYSSSHIINYGIETVISSKPFLIKIPRNVNTFETVTKNKSLYFVDKGTDEDECIFSKNEKYIYTIYEETEEQHIYRIEKNFGSNLEEDENPPEDYDKYVTICIGYDDATLYFSNEYGRVGIKTNSGEELKKEVMIVLEGTNLKERYGTNRSANYSEEKLSVYYLRNGDLCDRHGAAVEFELAEQDLPIGGIVYYGHTEIRMTEGEDENGSNYEGTRLAKIIIRDDGTFKEKSTKNSIENKIYFRTYHIDNLEVLNNKKFVMVRGTDIEGNRIILTFKEIGTIGEDWEEDIGNIRIENEAEEIPVMSEGKIYLYQVYLTGLERIEGEEVKVSVNGNDTGVEHKVERREVEGEEEVSIKLNTAHAAWYAIVGYGYKSRLKSVPVHITSPVVGSSIGLVSFQKDVALKLYNSVGGRYGSTEENTAPIEYRRIGAVTNEPMAPYSGTLLMPQTNYSINSDTYYIEHESGDPFTVLCVTQDIHVSDDQV
jgi:hypothetical protein